MRIVRSRTWPQVSASASPGRSPAYARSDSQGSPLVDFSYSYELESRETQAVRSGGGLTTETMNYVYDILGRLSELTLPSGIVRRYFFDLDSNRTEITENGQTTETYTYDPNNPNSLGVDQLTSATGPNRTFAYRADGETTQRGSDSLSWDGWGRHTGGSFGGTTVTYQFDPLGFRRLRTADGATTHYRLSGLFETDSAGAIQLTDIDGPAGDLAHYAGPPITSTAATYLYYNGHGGLAATSDQAGARTDAYTYDRSGRRFRRSHRIRRSSALQAAGTRSSTRVHRSLRWASARMTQP